MGKYSYPVIFEPEEIGFTVFVPDLPGCFTQGDSVEEALEYVQDAIGLMLEGLQPKDYPNATNLNELELSDQQFAIMVDFDKLAYDNKYNN